MLTVTPRIINGHVIVNRILERRVNSMRRERVALINCADKSSASKQKQLQICNGTWLKGTKIEKFNTKRQAQRDSYRFNQNHL